MALAAAARAKRNAKILRLGGRGASRRALALLFGLTERHVYNILVAARRASEARR